MKASLLAILLLIGGCAPAIVKPVTPFNDADFAAYTKKGSASVHGQAFMKTNGGDVKYGAGNNVLLIPATRYSEEALTILDEGGYVIIKIDPEWNKYTKTTQADATGNFEFSDLPAGDYFLECAITWSTGESRTGGLLRKKITLANSQSLKIILN